MVGTSGEAGTSGGHGTSGAQAARRDRARGALVGMALGDALGMPTQMWSRAEVAERFGGLTGLVDAPADQPIAPGAPAGTVTDDTAQAMMVAAELLAGDGTLDPTGLAARLVAWADALEPGSPDGPGPSTARALDHVRRTGEVAGAGDWGDTNGAAMRVAPVGVAWPSDPVSALVDAVVAADRLTHDTAIAHAGAAAVACAVSAGIDGLPREQILPLALSAAGEGARRGHRTPGPDVGARIAWACGLAGASEAPLDVIDLLVGTSVATQESVPAAFAIAATHDDPWGAVLAAAGLGGDADTVAAMVGAMVGARCGASAFPADAVALVARVNPELDLEGTADALLALRERRAGAAS